MAKFVFELEAVLRQREAVEQAKQRVVAELDARRLEFEEQIRGLQSGISNERLGLRDELASGKPINLSAVKLQTHASFRMVAKIQQLAIGLAGMYQRLARAREELRQAAAARKAIENLKERRFSEWKAEQSRIEARELDELSIMRASRQKAEVAA